MNKQEVKLNQSTESVYLSDQSNTLPQPEKTIVDEWIDYPELIKRYNIRGLKSVKDAQWRKKHNFYPCKQDGKGCAMRISVSKLDKWLRGEPE